jgi:hypothetical protein
MDESQFIKTDQSDQKTPSVSEVFEQLSSEEAVAFFGNRIQREMQLFNFDAEMTSIDVKEDDTYKSIDPIIGDEDLNELQLVKQLRAKRLEMDKLHDREEEVVYLEGFMQNRANQWRIAKTMVFGSFEPDAQLLVECIGRDARRKDTPFVPIDKFRALVDRSQPGIDIDAKENPIIVPLTAIVSAFGFISWEKGKGEHYKKEGISSPDLIKKYASLPTDIPPVESATALLLPDGSVIIQSREGHRVAAAKLKGQEYIEILYLKIKKAKQLP